jgi:serine/threonine protein kinase
MSIIVLFVCGIFEIIYIKMIQYLHSLGILYCDLRPKNFLFDEHGIIKLSDFKLARNISNCSVGNVPLGEGFSVLLFI